MKSGWRRTDVKRILLSVAAVLLTLYICDFVSARMQPLAMVEIRKYYAVRLKNDKIEYMFDSTASQECVHALLPQMGRCPCWYLERHKRQILDVGPPRLPQF
jgi:hypothetical protein